MLKFVFMLMTVLLFTPSIAVFAFLSFKTLKGFLVGVIVEEVRRGRPLDIPVGLHGIW